MVTIEKSSLATSTLDWLTQKSNGRESKDWASSTAARDLLSVDSVQGQNKQVKTIFSTEIKANFIQKMLEFQH
jgi:hypothetical protein